MNPKVLEFIEEYTEQGQEIILTSSFDQNVAILIHSETEAITILQWYDDDKYEYVYISDQSLDRLEKVIKEIRQLQEESKDESR